MYWEREEERSSVSVSLGDYLYIGDYLYNVLYDTQIGIDCMDARQGLPWPC